VAQTGTGTRTNDPKAIVRETTVGVTAMHDTVARLHGDDWRVALARHTARHTRPLYTAETPACLHYSSSVERPGQGLLPQPPPKRPRVGPHPLGASRLAVTPGQC
jgi:hypothetical protein